MLEIDNRIISRESPPYIIAELSANHNGSITRAKESIKEAKTNGADAIIILTEWEEFKKIEWSKFQNICVNHHGFLIAET